MSMKRFVDLIWPKLGFYACIQSDMAWSARSWEEDWPHPDARSPSFFVRLVEGNAIMVAYYIFVDGIRCWFTREKFGMLHGDD